MGGEPVTVEWINHASYLLAVGSVRLVTDPWLVGPAFDRGWARISASSFAPADLASVTHLWLSHEHPDHFSPPTLKGVPKEDRAGITVLYQRTHDKKVVDYCAAQGFTVREMENGQWLELGPGISVACATWPGGDSYLAVRAGSSTLLNLNDCVITSSADARQAAQRVGLERVDVLFTQFSYANWVGNPDERSRRRDEAEEKLGRMVAQVKALRPGWVVPFASFVWFCHEENAWANDEAVTVGRAAGQISDRTDAQAVVLYPGDRWVVGEPHANDAAVEAYERDRRHALAGPLLGPGPSVPVPELEDLADDFWNRIERINGRLMLAALRRSGLFGVADIWLTDHGSAFRFDPVGKLQADDRPENRCDVALSSEAFAFCLRHLYGGSTLLVNGRFRVPPGGSLAAFSRWLRLANLNNRGRSVLGAVPEIVERVGLSGRRRLAGAVPVGHRRRRTLNQR